MFGWLLTCRTLIGGLVAVALGLTNVPTLACRCHQPSREACCQAARTRPSSSCCRETRFACEWQRVCGCATPIDPRSNERKSPGTVTPAWLATDVVTALPPRMTITATMLARRDTGPPRDWVIELHCFRT
ncbi:MAG: hypothetical protein JNM18_19555 [Planctomycetaceae bacterium]|nr:hypothetical protein [Planctomycetaceae bacterium]